MLIFVFSANFKKQQNSMDLSRLRPYRVENTGSRPISEVKQRRAWLVLRWVTTWEPQVLLAFAIFERFSQKKFYAAFRFMSL